MAPAKPEERLVNASMQAARALHTFWGDHGRPCTTVAAATPHRFDLHAQKDILAAREHVSSSPLISHNHGNLKLSPGVRSAQLGWPGIIAQNDADRNRKRRSCEVAERLMRSYLSAPLTELRPARMPPSPPCRCLLPAPGEADRGRLGRGAWRTGGRSSALLGVLSIRRMPGSRYPQYRQRTWIDGEVAAMCSPS
jgi:hypothetical protein